MSLCLRERERERKRASERASERCFDWALETPDVLSLYSLSNKHDSSKSNQGFNFQIAEPATFLKLGTDQIHPKGKKIQKPSEIAEAPRLRAPRESSHH